MQLFYFFVTNIKTGKKSIEVTDVFAGDIGDHIFLSNEEYIINDYALEYEYLEEPEDY